MNGSLTSTHEAGHFVAYLAQMAKVGYWPPKVTLLTIRKNEPRTEYMEPKLQAVKDYLLDESNTKVRDFFLPLYLSGHAAELIALNRYTDFTMDERAIRNNLWFFIETSDDIKKSVELNTRLKFQTAKDGSRPLVEPMKATIELLTQHWQHVKYVSERLYAEVTIQGDELDMLTERIYNRIMKTTEENKMKI
jgi:hypothetical protein